jgi:L-aspartate oxidase
LKHLDKEKIKKRFHHIDLHLKDFGFDLTSDLLPIAPAAHYMVGGVRTNLDAETNISGLFVCGEAASTGVMGANRLASNSLLECLVFGKRASEKAAAMEKSEEELNDVDPIIVNTTNEKTFLAFQNEIAKLMSENLGIVRNKTDMQFALNRLTEMAIKYKDFNNEYNLLKIRNSATVCKLITNAALTREESRGGHIREDFQKEDPDFGVHIIQQKGEDVGFEPVRK